MPQARPGSTEAGCRESWKIAPTPAQVSWGANLGARAQEVNQWHCQTGPLLVWSVAENSSLPRASKNFSRPGGSETNLSAAAAAGQYAAPNRGRLGCTRTALKRCFPSTAPSVATMPWYHSDREETARSTAAIASAKCEPSLPLASKPTWNQTEPEQGWRSASPVLSPLPSHPIKHSPARFDRPSRRML